MKKSLHAHFSSLHTSERGSVIIMTTFAMFLTIMAVGVTVDMARQQTLHTRMQSALDAAALAVSTSSTTCNTQACMNTLAQKYFIANMPANYLGSGNISSAGALPTLTVTSNSNGSFVLTATTTQKTTFLRTFGMNNVNVGVSSSIGGTSGCAGKECLYVAQDTGGVERYDMNGYDVDCQAGSQAGWFTVFPKSGGGLAVDSGGNILFNLYDTVWSTAVNHSVASYSVKKYLGASTPTKPYVGYTLPSYTPFTPITTNQSVNITYPPTGGIFMGVPVRPGTTSVGYTINATYAVDTSNNIWAATTSNAIGGPGFITKYSPAGAKGVKFTLTGHAQYPKSIAVDAANNLWVVALGSNPWIAGDMSTNLSAMRTQAALGNYVQKYSTSGALIREWPLPNQACVLGEGTSVGCFAPMDMAVVGPDASGNTKVYVVNGVGPLREFDGNTGATIAQLGTFHASPFGDGSFLQQIAIDKDGNIFIAWYNRGSDQMGTIFKIAPDGTQSVFVEQAASGGMAINYKGGATNAAVPCTAAGKPRITQ